MSDNMTKLDAVLQPILDHADKLMKSRKRLDQTKAETIRSLVAETRREFVLLENACVRMGVNVIANVADQPPRPPASGGAPAESALLGGAAPTGKADGIRHAGRALRPPSNALSGANGATAE